MVLERNCPRCRYKLRLKEHAAPLRQVVVLKGNGLTEEYRKFGNWKDERWDCHNCGRKWLFILNEAFFWDEEEAKGIWLRYKGEPLIFR